jgi:hypothetical protein
MLSHRDPISPLARDAAVDQKGPALRVAQRKSLDIVAGFARGTTPRFSPLLASDLLWAITVYECG